MNIKSKILNISIDNIAEMLRSDVIPDEPGQSGDITLINTCRNMWPEWVTDFLGPFKEEDSCVVYWYYTVHWGMCALLYVIHPLVNSSFEFAAPYFGKSYLIVYKCIW